MNGIPLHNRFISFKRINIFQLLIPISKKIILEFIYQAVWEEFFLKSHVEAMTFVSAVLPITPQAPIFSSV